MKFSTSAALVVGLFASSIAAAPSEATKQRFKEHRAAKRDAKLALKSAADFGSSAIQGQQKSNFTETTYSSNWAGAVQVSPPSGTYNAISAQWTLPQVAAPVSGAGEWYNSEWVGIDGDTCGQAILQAGTLSYVEVDDNGGVTTGSAAWYEWYPVAEIEFTDFEVNIGDTVYVGITASSTSEGFVEIYNFSTGEEVTTTVSAPSSSNVLCGQNAEWILEDFSSGGGLVPFATFSDVYFVACTASTTSGASIGLTNAQVFDLYQNDVVLTDAEIVTDSELYLHYI